VKTSFLTSFLRDVKKLPNARIRRDVERAILEIESAPELSKVSSIKRLSGHSNYFRLRLGEWRIGIKMHDGEIMFVRCLHRREIYRFFP